MKNRMTYKARLVLDVYVDVDNYSQRDMKDAASRKNTDINTIHKDQAVSLVAGVAHAIKANIPMPENVQVEMVKKPTISGRALMTRDSSYRDINENIPRKTWVALDKLRYVGYQRLIRAWRG